MYWVTPKAMGVTCSICLRATKILSFYDDFICIYWKLSETPIQLISGTLVGLADHSSPEMNGMFGKTSIQKVNILARLLAVDTKWSPNRNVTASQTGP